MALVALNRNIAPAVLKHDLHMELRALIQRRNMQFGVDDHDIGIRKDILRLDFTFARLIDNHLLGAIAIQLAAQLLEVENDFGNIFLHALDDRELMEHTVDAHTRHRHTGQAREQHATHGIAKRSAESAL